MFLLVLFLRQEKNSKELIAANVSFGSFLAPRKEQ